MGVDSWLRRRGRAKHGAGHNGSDRGDSGHGGRGNAGGGEGDRRRKYRSQPARRTQREQLDTKLQEPSGRGGGGALLLAGLQGRHVDEQVLRLSGELKQVGQGEEGAVAEAPGRRAAFVHHQLGQRLARSERERHCAGDWRELCLSRCCLAVANALCVGCLAEDGRCRRCSASVHAVPR